MTKTVLPVGLNVHMPEATIFKALAGISLYENVCMAWSLVKSHIPLEMISADHKTRPCGKIILDIHVCGVKNLANLHRPTVSDYEFAYDGQTGFKVDSLVCESR